MNQKVPRERHGPLAVGSSLFSSLTTATERRTPRRRGNINGCHERSDGVSDRETADVTGSDDAHSAAARAFVDRVRSRFSDEIAELYVFGSTARGEPRGLASDVDVLVVLDTADDEAITDTLRDVAYDVMLEYGPVVELHVLSKREFEASRDQGNPFIRNVVREGRSYA